MTDVHLCRWSALYRGKSLMSLTLWCFFHFILAICRCLWLPRISHKSVDIYFSQYSESVLSSIMAYYMSTIDVNLDLRRFVMFVELCWRGKMAVAAQATRGPPRLLCMLVLGVLAMASFYCIFMLLGMQLLQTSTRSIMSYNEYQTPSFTAETQVLHEELDAAAPAQVKVHILDTTELNLFLIQQNQEHSLTTVASLTAPGQRMEPRDLFASPASVCWSSWRFLSWYCYPRPCASFKVL